MVATMYFMRVFILGKILGNNQLALRMSELEFALLVLSFVLIAAGGNIINDYFDLRADRINKPHRVIIGKHVKRRVAMVSHLVFNAIGILIGGYLAWRVGMWNLLIVHLFASGSLWFYSVILKREFLIGNIVIALLAALVPLAVGLFEIPLTISAYGEEVSAIFLELDPEVDPMIFFKILYYFILGFAGYAFLLTLIREIQKDMADIEGDRAVGCRTIPIVLGIKKAKLITLILLGVTQVTIFMCWFYLFGDWYTIAYAAVLIMLPLSLSMWKTFLAIERRDFVHAFSFTKLAMGTGLCYALVFSLLN
jgi:4-hydroxybenzoate polyprenyltransferase